MMRLGKIQLCVFCSVLLAALSLPSFPVMTTLAQSDKSFERERERAYNKQLFKKTFHDIQILGQELLKDHEAGLVTAGRLAKDTKAINKCAKTLRSLTVLGTVIQPKAINKEIATPSQYDQAIRSLAKHIWDFAHNPVLQNNKVFNTDQAQQAQTDLEAIMNLSKIIENKAKGYVPTVTSTR